MNKDEVKMIALSTLISRATTTIIPMQQNVHAVFIDTEKSISKEDIQYYSMPVVAMITDEYNNLKYVTHSPDGPVTDIKSASFLGYFKESDIGSYIVQRHGEIFFERAMGIDI